MVSPPRRLRAAPRPPPVPAASDAADVPAAPAAPAAPTRHRLDTDARREQLLALGLAMFSQRSFEEVQIDDVARAAGISRGLLYHYFPNKRDFYLAVLRAAATKLLDATAATPDTPPYLRLRAGLRAYLDFARSHARGQLALLRSGVGIDPEVAGIVQRVRKALAERVLEGIGLAHPTPAVTTLVWGWIGLVEATSLEWLDAPTLSPDALLELWSSSLLRLLAPELPPEALPGHITAP